MLKKGVKKIVSLERKYSSDNKNVGFFRKEPTMVERKNKRGLSTIVATLLIILLTLVAVGIIWVVVRNVIQGGAEQISLGKFTLDLEIRSVARNAGTNSMDIKLKRNPGEGELSGLVFIAVGDENTEIVNVTDLTLRQLEERTFNINLTSSTNVSGLEKVAVAPIFVTESGEEVIGDIADEYYFSNPTEDGGVECINNCSILGYNCGIQNVCGTLTNCGNCLAGYDCNSTGQCVFNHIPTLSWIFHPRIVNGLLSLSPTSSNPVVFYKDSSWYIITGEDSGVFFGYVWNGLRWVSNSTIVSGLTDIGERATPTVYYKDSSWNLISGAQNGNFYGFTWNGNQWVSNSTLVSSLPNVGASGNSVPFVFYKDSSWYMIAANYTGKLYGFTWNGNQWVSNSTIILGLPYMELQIKPYAFYKDSSWYIISGNWTGNFNSFAWNGTQWEPNLTINAGLVTPGGYSSAPSVFHKDNKWYVISGNTWGAFYGFIYGDNSSGNCIPDCTGRTCGDDGCGGSCGACSTGTCIIDGQCIIPPIPVWKPNFAINSSLGYDPYNPYIGGSPKSVFYKDSSWYLLSGGDGRFFGYVWNGTTWRTNLTINASLPDIGYSSAPTVFYKDSSWYLISGGYYGNFYGYVWNGTNWRVNLTINSSLPGIGYSSAPTVFYKDSSWYLLAGEYYGKFFGYVWNGTTWRVNLTINSSLVDLGGTTVPSVFYKDSSWYLIAGAQNGEFYGYIWNGTTWVSNTTIVEHLPDVNSWASPSVFYKDSSWYLLSGSLLVNTTSDYSFKGFIYGY